MFLSSLLFAASIFGISNVETDHLACLETSTVTQSCLSEFMAPYFIFLPEGVYYQEGILYAISLVSKTYDNEFQNSLNTLKTDFNHFNKYRDSYSAAKVINSCLYLVKKNHRDDLPKEQIYILIDELIVKDVSTMEKPEFWSYKGEIDFLAKLLVELDSEEIQDYYSLNIGAVIKLLAFESITREEMKSFKIALDASFHELKTRVESYIPSEGSEEGVTHPKE